MVYTTTERERERKRKRKREIIGILNLHHRYWSLDNLKTEEKLIPKSSSTLAQQLQCGFVFLFINATCVIFNYYNHEVENVDYSKY